MPSHDYSRRFLDAESTAVARFDEDSEQMKELKRLQRELDQQHELERARVKKEMGESVVDFMDEQVVKSVKRVPAIWKVAGTGFGSTFVSVLVAIWTGIDRMMHTSILMGVTTVILTVLAGLYSSWVAEAVGKLRKGSRGGF